MITERVLFFAGYTAAAVLPLILLPFVRRNSSSAGVTGMVTLIVGIFLWGISTGLLYYSKTPEFGLVGANIRLFSVYVTVGGWLLIAIEYTELVETPWKALVALLIPATVVQLVAWGFPVAIWGDSSFEIGWETTTGLFRAHAAYNYLLAGVTLVLFAGDAIASRGLRRKQSVALFVSLLPPLAANLAFQIGDTPSIDPTPLGLFVSVYVLGWALFRADFLDLVPVGRHRAIEQLSDPVVTIGHDGRVVDCNRSARAFADVDQAVIGQHYQSFFKHVPSVADAIDDLETGATELTVEGDGDLEHYDLSVTRIGTSADAGRIVVLRDVTALRERERVLEESQQELELLRQVFERTLRHNVRNDINLIRGYAEQIRAEADDEPAAAAEQITATSTELIDASEKARTVGRLVDRPESPVEIDLHGSIEALVEGFEETYPDVRFSIDGAGSVRAYVDPTIQIGLQNLIENAAEHNSGDDQRVSISLRTEGESIVVTIEDNGPGIPDDELAVIENGEETALKHGSGVGMWVIYWVDETTSASIEFDVSDTGTTARVIVPAARSSTQQAAAAPHE